LRRGQMDEAASGDPLLQIATTPKTVMPKDNRFVDDQYAIAGLLDETARLWRSRYEGQVRAQLPDMTRARCAVIVFLAQHEGTNQAALADILDIRPSSLVRLLDRLETGGYVARKLDPQDRRAHVLMLTSKSLPIVDAIHDLVRKSDDELRVGLSKSEARQLHALLCRIRSNLADGAGPEAATETL